MIASAVSKRKSWALCSDGAGELCAFAAIMFSWAVCRTTAMYPGATVCSEHGQDTVGLGHCVADVSDMVTVK